MGAEVTVEAIGNLPPTAVREADLVLAGTWVEGFVLFGVGPAKAMRRWVADLPDMTGKPVGVFCTYAFNPRNTLTILADGFTAHGARVVARHAAHRRNPTAGMASFVETAVEAVSG